MREKKAVGRARPAILTGSIQEEKGPVKKGRKIPRIDVSGCIVESKGEAKKLEGTGGNAGKEEVTKSSKETL